MYAVEFEAQVENGQIAVPEKFRNRLFGAVRVLVLLGGENGFASTGDKYQSLTDGSEDQYDAVEARRPGESFLAYRLRNPYQVIDFQPLTREVIHERREDYKPD